MQAKDFCTAQGTVKYENHPPYLGEQQGPAGKPFRLWLVKVAPPRPLWSPPLGQSWDS